MWQVPPSRRADHEKSLEHLTPQTTWQEYDLYLYNFLAMIVFFLQIKHEDEMYMLYEDSNKL